MWYVLVCSDTNNPWRIHSDSLSLGALSTCNSLLTRLPLIYLALCPSCASGLVWCRMELHTAPCYLREPAYHDLWLQPQTPMLQPRLLTVLQPVGALQCLKHLKLVGIHTVTSSQLQQALAGLSVLEQLDIRKGSASLHNLRILSPSLKILRVRGLEHVLTWWALVD